MTPSLYLGIGVVISGVFAIGFALRGDDDPLWLEVTCLVSLLLAWPLFVLLVLVSFLSNAWDELTWRPRK